MEHEKIAWLTVVTVVALTLVLFNIFFMVPFLRDGSVLFIENPVLSKPDEPDPPASTAEPLSEEEQTRLAEEQERLTELENSARYREAKTLLFRREFKNAFVAFSLLGDYSDSAYWADFAANYPFIEPEFGDRMINDKYLNRSYEHGNIYSLSDYDRYNGRSLVYKGLVYVPDTIDNSTTFVQYYCGGDDGGDYLWYKGVYDYFLNYSPNAVIVFTNDSGSQYMHRRNAYQWQILSQLAYECGTVLHDVSVIGTSQGSYTAMQLAYDFYSDYGVKVRKCVTLDTGCDWSLNYLALTADQCGVLAEAGTALYVFEDFNFKKEIQYDAVQNILNSGMEVHAYVCKSNDHDCINQNAFSLGFFSFCAGEKISFPECEYCGVELYPGITELGELSWPPRPASETRTIYQPVKIGG